MFNLALQPSLWRTLPTCHAWACGPKWMKSRVEQALACNGCFRTRLVPRLKPAPPGLLSRPVEDCEDFAGAIGNRAQD